MKKILSREQLCRQANLLRSAGKKIAATNGCFDLLHVGHVRFLKAARELVDVLIVGVNSDASVQSLKGAGRPIVTEDERAEVLAGLECVDFVSIFPETTAVEFLRVVNPHVYVKGGDYEAGQLPETPVVENLGGQVVILGLTAHRSTTDLIKRAAGAVAYNSHEAKYG